MLAGVRRPPTPIAGAVPRGQANIPTDRKVALALDLERRAISIDPRVTKVDAAQVGDAVSRVAIASTAGRAGRVRAHRRVVRRGHAGRSRATRRRPGSPSGSPAARRARLGGGRRRGGRRAVQHARRREAADREGPGRARPVRGVSFLGVLAGALSAEAVLKGRSLFAAMVGSRWAPSCSRSSTTAAHRRARRRAVRRRGRADRADRAVHARRAERVPAQHVHGARGPGGGTRSTGNAKRGGYRARPASGTSNFYLDAGERTFDELLARAEGGVLIRDVSGVHSGANPISGEFWSARRACGSRAARSASRSAR